MFSLSYAPSVRTVLQQLFASAASAKTLPRSVPEGFSCTSGPAKERSDVMATSYMPISPRCGDLLYSLTRANFPSTVVEFGTSFGISTIYLAAALADNRRGHIYTTELSEHKVNAAQANLIGAGLADRVTVLPGDARETLRDVEGPIDLVLLDGWKDLCLPVLKLLEPKLAPGALIVADDIDQRAMNDYLQYVRTPSNGYVSVPFLIDDGMEISFYGVKEAQRLPN